MTVTLDDIIVKKSGQMEANIGSETLMMSVDLGRYYSVSEVGQAIWQEIDRPIRVSSIVDVLMRSYDVERTACEEETLRFLNDLMDQHLIDRVDDTGAKV
ncbi:lasso peptide biosynthesis PqqD family chaperone [Aestuariicoccus sp. MJ-SS9]|uniref:lasso peptide biosynthesis PqqD family chaperone n=1 Tax=Aestuariicoccus sp. MJ-SS9 TaxID=3079855 RepID=UPI002913AF6B|nr:lasso peptide biosynthesis PqqD family chaperone [Aestuariicoccus sp. MJ-SS9]MDU8913530.1 lasso peptide biosynthesis PqqD family chaperone [Aestuariicoccus sp. MJ-SS9]